MLTTNWNSDTIAVKLLVYVCALLNAAHAALECFNIYLAGVTGFGIGFLTAGARVLQCSSPNFHRQPGDNACLS